MVGRKTSYDPQKGLNKNSDVLVSNDIPEDSLAIISNSELVGYNEVLTENQLEDKETMKRIRNEQVKIFDTLNVLVKEIKDMKLSLSLMSS